MLQLESVGETWQSFALLHIASNNCWRKLKLTQIPFKLWKNKFPFHSFFRVNANAFNPNPLLLLHMLLQRRGGQRYPAHILLLWHYFFFICGLVAEAGAARKSATQNCHRREGRRWLDINQHFTFCSISPACIGRRRRRFRESLLKRNYVNGN